MPVDAAHLHLLLNHFPTIGFIIGLGFYLVALRLESDDLTKAGLIVFVGVALVTLPVYVTGNAAQFQIRDQVDLPGAVVESHEGAAFLALVLIELTGALAWLSLWRQRRTGRWAPALHGVVAVLALAAFAVVALAARIGGDIRHEEIRASAESSFPALARTFGDIMTKQQWPWVAAETLHFVGLALLIGVVGLLTLRAFGVMKSIPAEAIDRLLPLGILGFAVNTATGMLFFAGAYGQYINSAAFFYKVACIMVAGACLLYFTIDGSWLVQEGRSMPPLARACSAVTLAFWMAVLFFGSMLPFLGTSF